MKLGVVIVSYRTPHDTVRAVLSAVASGISEVVVIDNASRDDTLASLQRLTDSRVVVVENDTNAGFGTAANRGARESSSDALIFLNSDAELTEIAVARLANELVRLNGRAMLGPRLVGPEGAVQRSAGVLPRPLDVSIRALGFYALAQWLEWMPPTKLIVSRSRIANEYASAEKVTRTVETTMVSGACIAIGREAFEELGGFDERFFMYFEDADLCRRAAAAGMPIRFVPSAVVTHIGGASSSEDYHFGPLHARSMRQYLGKWYGPAGSALALLLLWLRAVGFSLAARPGAKRAWRALWAAMRDEDPRR